MKNLFGYEGPIFSFFDKFANLLVLNILWLACCIPIITIGASTTALYYVTLKMVKDEESYIIKSFFKSFKQNFRQATIIWIILLLIGTIVYCDIRVSYTSDSMIFDVIRVASYVLGFVLILIGLYVFAVLAKFDNTVANTIKNALIFSMLNAPYTLTMAITYLIPIAIVYFIPQLIPLVALLCGAFVSYASSTMFVKIFDKIIALNSEEENAQGDEVIE